LSGDERERPTVHSEFITCPCHVTNMVAMHT
jgi:hypothetical protein